MKRTGFFKAHNRRMGTPGCRGHGTAGRGPLIAGRTVTGGFPNRPIVPGQQAAQVWRAWPVPGVHRGQRVRQVPQGLPAGRVPVSVSWS